MAFMDRDGNLLQGELFPSSIPPRVFTPMPIQTLVPWTLPRLVAAGLAWLTVETMPAQPEPVTAAKRRV